MSEDLQLPQDLNKAFHGLLSYNDDFSIEEFRARCELPELLRDAPVYIKYTPSQTGNEFMIESVACALVYEYYEPIINRKAPPEAVAFITQLIMMIPELSDEVKEGIRQKALNFIDENIKITENVILRDERGIEEAYRKGRASMRKRKRELEGKKQEAKKAKESLAI